MSSVGHQENLPLGIVYALSAGVSWSIMDSAIKHLVTTFGYTVWEVAFLRAGGSAIFIAAIYVAIYKKYPKTYKWKLIWLRGICGAVVSLGIFYAISHGELGAVTVIVKSSTIWTAVFAALLLKEKFSLRLFILILVGLVGVGFVANAPLQLNGPSLPYVVATVTAIIFGFTSAIIRKLHATESSTSIVLGFLYVSALVTFPFAVATLHIPSAAEIPWLLTIVIFGAGSQFFVTRCFKYAPASVVYPFTLSEVILSALLGASLFGEKITSTFIFGAALVVLSGIGIVWWRDKHPAKAAQG